ncbi:MAG: lipoate--protein ligase [Bacteroidales bacterium]|nr:lipoate--protein ligase [Bacteroidales bacterium]
MLGIINKITDPHFNLALEEYFLKNSDEEIFIIWQSDPVIVVGKHQNTYAEINYPFVKKGQIKVARRLTGGGTVFHDEGNINFTFIRNGEPGKLVDFKRFVTPVTQFLNKIGVPAMLGGKNDILINGEKISGNAEHVYKTRVLHHGTLLYNSDLPYLKEAIKITAGKYFDKSVQSNRSKVVNISSYLDKTWNIIRFKDAVFDYVLNSLSDTEKYTLSDNDISIAGNLAKNKYATWAWIYGYSPAYILKNYFTIKNLKVHFELSVSKGFIREFLFNDDVLPFGTRKYLTGILNNLQHKEDIIRNKLHTKKDKLHLSDKEIEAFLSSLF